MSEEPVTLGPVADGPVRVFELQDYRRTPTDQLTMDIIEPFTHGHQMHPSLDGVRVWLNLGEVHVHLPLMGDYDSIRYGIDQLTRNVWVRLLDAEGNSLPVSIFREADLRILGRWE
jgi:hypothetical protein